MTAEEKDDAVYRNRQARAREALAEAGAEVLLITRPENCRYLTGFTGESGTVFLSGQGTWLLVDFRFYEAAQEEVKAATAVHQEGGWLEAVARFVAEKGWGSVAVEGHHLSYQRFQDLAAKLAPVKVVARSGLIERLRQVKGPEEIALLRKAAQITDAAFAHIVRMIRPGVSEKDLALELDYFLGRQGAEAPAFPTIVASGPRAARPHAVPGRHPVMEGELLLLDFGAVWGGYHADMTRTVAVGHVGDKERQIYGIVLAAQQKALEAIRPGRTCAEIDAIAREEIARAGYGACFGHRVGHSVGLAVHEEPSLGEGEETVLVPGMVFTVEPGIYLSGWGGVRIEDLVVVTPDGVELLSHAPKELMVVGG